MYKWVEVELVASFSIALVPVGISEEFSKKKLSQIRDMSASGSLHKTSGRDSIIPNQFSQWCQQVSQSLDKWIMTALSVCRFWCVHLVDRGHKASDPTRWHISHLISILEFHIWLSYLTFIFDFHIWNGKFIFIFTSFRWPALCRWINIKSHNLQVFFLHIN